MTNGAPPIGSPCEAELERAILTLDRVAVVRLLQGHDGAAASLGRIEHVLGPVLERIGEGWTEGRVSLSQVYMAGRLCEQVVDSLAHDGCLTPRVHAPLAIAVLDDYHLLGLRVVSSVLRSAGYAVRDFGSCSVERLVDRVRAEGIAVLLVSVLMLPSALRVRELVSRLRHEGLPTRVVVGGAPFRLDPSLAAEVGADAWGAAAGDAVRLVRYCLGEAP